MTPCPQVRPTRPGPSCPKGQPGHHIRVQTSRRLQRPPGPQHPQMPTLPHSLTSLLSGDDRGLQRLSPALPCLGRQPEDVGGLGSQLCGRELPHCGADLNRGEGVGAAAGQAIGDLVACGGRNGPAQPASLAPTEKPHPTPTPQTPTLRHPSTPTPHFLLDGAYKQGRAAGSTERAHTPTNGREDRGWPQAPWLVRASGSAGGTNGQTSPAELPRDLPTGGWARLPRGGSQRGVRGLRPWNNGNQDEGEAVASKKREDGSAAGVEKETHGANQAGLLSPALAALPCGAGTGHALSRS